MKLFKKISNVLLIAFMTAMCISATNAYASDDNYNFKFQISQWYGNGNVETGRERTTTNVNNTWKVNLLSSEEGTGTYANFWLEKKDGTNVSGAIKAKQGNGAYYRPAYSAANKAVVYLTGENNNFNSHTYYVSGYWDEETGVIVYLD